MHFYEFLVTESGKILGYRFAYTLLNGKKITGIKLHNNNIWMPWRL